MGKILTIATSKGGGGKTALVTVLAANLAGHGYQIMVIDADRNRTFWNWHQNYYEGSKIGCRVELEHVRVIDLALEESEKHDLVLIDTAGFENLTAAAAMSCANWVLIPCMNDRGSVNEAIKTARQVGSLSKAARRHIPSSVVMMRWHEKGMADRAALQDLWEAGVRVCASRIPDLSDFAKTTYSGKVMLGGRLGLRTGGLIEELINLGAIPALKETVA